jgi:hypothetical protein
MSYLIFVNELGPNYRGDNIYEFIFSDNVDDIWGENWDSKPANGYPFPPDLDYIDKVGILKNNDIDMLVAQQSDYFSMMDAIDGVVALAWEKDDNDVDFTMKKRLVFRFGESEQLVKDKLYERDLVLEFEKKLIHEK